MHLREKIPRIALINVARKYQNIGNFAPRVRQIKEEATDILKDLGSELVVNEWMYDVKSAREVVSEFKKTNPEAMVLNVIGWVGGDPIFILGRETGKIPMILWVRPEYQMSLSGYLEASASLASTKRDFKLVLGRTREEIKVLREYIQSATLVRRLQGSNFGQIGYPPPSFVDVVGDELTFRAKLGINVEHLDVSELFSEIDKVCENEAEKTKVEWKKKVSKIDVPDKELFKAAKVSLALQNIVHRYELSGYAIRCKPELQYEFCSPCLGLSTLSEMGIVGACEGDLPSAITMFILQELGKGPPCVFDCVSADIERGTLSLWHCGQHATTLVKDTTDLCITSPALPPNSPGVVLSSLLKEGEATLAKLNQRGDEMLIISGKSVEPKEKMRGSYAEIQLSSEIKNVLNKMGKKGMGHHLCLTYGNMVSSLQILCEMLQVTPLLP